jgi:hypothetical protein
MAKDVQIMGKMPARLEAIRAAIMCQQLLLCHFYIYGSTVSCATIIVTVVAPVVTVQFLLN